MLINISRVGVRRMGPNSFQWCPATGQGAMGTNWSRGSSVWTWGRTSSLWGWQSTRTGCPGRLWSLLLWRYSRPTWTRSCAACFRWPCFSWGVGLDGPQRSLPTPNILWFCEQMCFSLFLEPMLLSADSSGQLQITCVASLTKGSFALRSRSQYFSMKAELLWHNYKAICKKQEWNDEVYDCMRSLSNTKCKSLEVSWKTCFINNTTQKVTSIIVYDKVYKPIALLDCSKP